ncbi:hypothetical protein BJ508DRAFT_378867 [Ascobolus immersus RN42]|uniref:Uncharacterized protein n=1 Tax=Ascobolus immersus RN42 TaxID=1160509 RepID=A0A3N4HUA6_ASCIM|nr:hypothetical protein BJ508DRAFT_378867 [Ascobolus immersus RN42]
MNVIDRKYMKTPQIPYSVYIDHLNCLITEINGPSSSKTTGEQKTLDGYNKTLSELGEKALKVQEEVNELFESFHSFEKEIKEMIEKRTAEEPEPSTLQKYGRKVARIFTGK